MQRYFGAMPGAAVRPTRRARGQPRFRSSSSITARCRAALRLGHALLHKSCVQRDQQQQQDNAGREAMYRSSAGALILAAALMVTMSSVQPADDPKYPNWKGQWITINHRLGGQVIKFDPNKPWGLGQEAPLTPEYQKVLEQSMADQAKGGIGNYPTARCLPGGMPRMMAAPVMEYVITPETTYILMNTEMRRIFTDGRAWPPPGIEPTYQGYSLGTWIDEDKDGRYDVL